MSYIINSLIKIYTEIALGQNIQTIETKKSMLKDVSKCQSTVSMVLKVASIHNFSPSGKEPSAYFSLFTAINLALGLYLKL